MPRWCATYEHVFPVRPGTEALPLEKLLEEQWYRLAWWRVADEELNYRRFFDVDSLAGLRVERDEVFTATHRLTLGLLREGVLDGLRVDHPDGLTDPEGYLERLEDAGTRDLDRGGEDPAAGRAAPRPWRCDGTTGYDTLDVVSGLFIDPVGWASLASDYVSRTGADPDFVTVADRAKREVLESVLRTDRSACPAPSPPRSAPPARPASPRQETRASTPGRPASLARPPPQRPRW